MDSFKIYCFLVVFTLNLVLLSAQNTNKDDVARRDADQKAREKNPAFHPSGDLVDVAWGLLSRQVEFFEAHSDNLGATTYSGGKNYYFHVGCHEKFIIEITLLEFDLAPALRNGDCTDYFEMWTGRALVPTDATRLVAKTCGNRRNYPLSTEYSTTSNETTFHFFSADNGLPRTNKGADFLFKRVLSTKKNAIENSQSALQKSRQKGGGNGALTAENSAVFSQGSHCLLSISFLFAVVSIFRETGLTQGLEALVTIFHSTLSR